MRVKANSRGNAAPGSDPSGTRRGLTLLLLVTALVAGSTSCTDIGVTRPGEPGEFCRNTGECATGLNCVANVCTGEVPTDTQDAETLDTVPDVVPDVVDVEVSDVVDATDVLTDDGGDEELPDVVEQEPDVADADADVEPDTPPDEITIDVPDVEDTDTGPIVNPGLGEECNGDCQAGLLCLPQTDGTSRCTLFPDGVCKPCETPADCPTSGAECLQYPNGKFCGAPCTDTCAEGFYCDSGQCKPVTNQCACTPAIFGLGLPCENDTPDGTCSGQTVCVTKGWTTCSALPPQAELCDGKDNDCDGVTDEEPLYMEGGEAKPFGTPCGLGQCVGGEVVCDGDGGVTCSSNELASPELCADALDNDCDGVVNEGCESDDLDGDGVPNDTDCAPFDSDTYAGAPEKCCNPALGYNEACDTNCDGSVTPCASCDGDFDGYCPSDGDCNDGDPSIHPGAPEKCNDGVDQDCQGGDLLCPPGADSDGDGYIPPADCNEGNPSVNPGAEEVCDNLDNDCDGAIDEDNPQGGTACGTGPEFCQAGVQVCTHYGYGAVVECQGEVLFAAEKCDGKDNDCSGGIDEPWPELGTACDGPDVDQCANGIWECSSDQLGIVCGTEAIANLIEECNGLDDDCNGATDEFVCNLDDLDGDGYTTSQGDCNDLLAEYHPGAPEPCCDPALGASGQTICDKDCNGIVAPCAFNDADVDGFPASTDCNDNDPTIYPGAPEKCGDGVDQDCAGGDLQCSLIEDKDNDKYPAGVDCNDNNASVHPNAFETCNYVDDDCDGIIDNGNPSGMTGPCGPDTDQCTPGQWVCVHDQQTYTVEVLCINDKFQEPELCNGMDDDCDGEVDETFYDLGQPCDGPDADECANGVFGCKADGSGVECGAEDPADIPEICDAFDNDCDGQTDEGLSYGSSVPLGGICDGVGQCGAGVAICNVMGQVTCSTNPDGPFSQAIPEICNEADDDCDGETDEDFTWQGIAIGEECDGIGKCGPGVVECGADLKPTCSTNANGSQSEAEAEVCDGIDNDCDGSTDNGLGLEQSPCKKIGVCETGTVAASCVGAEWVCDYGSVAGYEEEETLCDGLDNDCDGETDEDHPLGETCDGDDVDKCAFGTWTCKPDGSGVECVNETTVGLLETCNGVDDDCDGVTDNLAVDPIAEGCFTTGVCSQLDQIKVICDLGGGPNTCDYTLVEGYQATEAACDKLDNDCDGKTDENLTYNGNPLGQPCVGKGECGAGIVQCNVDSAQTICSTEAGGDDDQSTEELCDGLDNDCDGETDEGFAWNDLALGSACSPGGICSEGVVECLADGSGAVCSTVLGGSNDQTIPETCDGVDSDCDGQTDEIEDLDATESGCKLIGVCSDPLEFVVCNLGVWECNYGNIPDYQGSENACDELDNDCDGETDEGFPLKGLPCDGDDFDQCATGTWTCSQTGGLECTNETGVGQPEICDGLDNDCDGVKDNGVTYQGLKLNSLCDGKGACGLGFVQCNGSGQATCSTNPDGSNSQAQPEICDGLDNDCDGTADEGLSWNGVAKGMPCDGTGACGEGVVVCSPVDVGQTTCSTNPNGTAYDGSDEVCNGVDDDCDGQTDDTPAQVGERCDGDDADSCQTGKYACTDGSLVCENDFECATGSVCYDPGAPAVSSCLCLGAKCSVREGDTCDDTGAGCLCGGGSACNPSAGTICQSGTGCVAQ